MTARSYDLERVRSHFPGLSRLHANEPTVFFDNPAGTQIAREAMNRMVDAMTYVNANLGGKFKSSIEAETMVREVHAIASDFVGASDPEEIFFGQSMTALTFAMSRSLGGLFAPGDEIILTRMDHDANITPWVMLAEERGLTIRWLDFDPETFRYDLSTLHELIRPKTRLVAINHASNVLGTVNNVSEVVRAAKSVGAFAYIDAVQSAPHVLLDINKLGCDFLVCSAYKFYGPHYAILWGRRSILDNLIAYNVRAASPLLPFKFVMGTTNREALAGIRGAIEYIEWLGVEFGRAEVEATRRDRIIGGIGVMRAHEEILMRRLIDGLSRIKGLCVLGPGSSECHDRVPTVSFVLDGHNPMAIATFLGNCGINVWHGHNYAVEAMKRLGLLHKGGVVRIGPAHYNSTDEIDRMLDVLREYLAKA